MSKKDILIVPDTNIFLNAMLGKGMFPMDMQILDLEEQNKIKFATSEYSQNELYKIISREIEVRNIFDCRDIYISIYQILERSKFIPTPFQTDKLSTDKSDQFFLDLAVHAGADFFVSNDTRNNLLNIGEHKDVKIVKPKKFLRDYKKNIRNAK
jgi:putative PIN family toxin of toxin-antitoxin system